MPKNKVYCKNCLCCIEPISSRDYCDRDTEVNRYTDMVTLYADYKFTPNTEGLCPFYKKKGWKFWVR